MAIHLKKTNQKSPSEKWCQSQKSRKGLHSLRHLVFDGSM